MVFGFGPLGSSPLGGLADSTEGTVTPLTIGASTIPEFSRFNIFGAIRSPTTTPTFSIVRDNGKLLNIVGHNPDPYFSSTKALLRFEGADASTTFTNEASARVFTAQGDAQLDDAQTYYGLTSGLFDGTGDYLTTPDHADFQLGGVDFTIDATIRITVTGKIHIICCKRAATSANEYTFNVNANNTLGLAIYSAGSSTGTATGATALELNRWYRVAGERQGTTLRIYVDGVLDGTGTQTGGHSVSNATFQIGRSLVNTTRDFQGWINDFRLTKGVARYGGSNYSVTLPYGTNPTLQQAIVKSTDHPIDRIVNPTFNNLVKKTTAWAIDRVINPTHTAIRRTLLPRTVTQANDPPTFASQLTKAPLALTTPLINRQTVIAKKIRSKSGRRGVQTASGYPELVGFQHDVGTPGGGFSLTIPSNIQADDIAVVGAIWTDALDDPPYPYASTPPGGGWNLIFERGMNDAGYGGMMWKFWWKRLNGTEGGASCGSNFTDGTLLSWIGAGITVWRGCEPDLPPIEEWQHRGPTTANPHQGQALPAAVDKSVLVTYILSTVDNVRGTPVDPAIEIDDYGSASGNDGAFAMLYQNCPTVGTYGPIQHTMGGNYNYGSFSFMLKPSQPASGGGGDASGLDEIGTTAFVNKGFPYRITSGNAVVDATLPMTNPGFETGDATGWSQIIGSNVQVRATGADGITASGSWYGAGAANASVAWWGQTVSFSPSVWSFIDSGVVSVTISVAHTGYTDTDYGALYVECLNGSGVWLSDKRNNFSDPSTWTTETVTVLVPVGCRSLRISTQNVRITGTQLSSYWDDFSPVVSLVEGSTVMRHDLAFSEKGNSIAGWTATVGTFAAVTSAITWLYEIMYAQSSASVAAYKDYTPAADTLSYIDAGTATIEMSVQLGGGNSEQDPCRVFVECLDASDVVLGTLQTAAVETAYTNTFTAFNLSMAVPALTRKLRVNYTGTRVTASNLDGYMTRLSVFLLAVPTYVAPYNPIPVPSMAKAGTFSRTFAPVVDGLAAIGKAVARRIESTIDAVTSYVADHITDGETTPLTLDALSDSQTSLRRDTTSTVTRTTDAVTSLVRSTGQLFNRTSDVALSLVRSTAKPFAIESKGQPLVYSYGAHRYWRIRAPETNNGSGYLGFTKVKLRASPGGTDLANGRTASASAIHGSYPPSNATDSNSSTFWTTVTAAAPAGGHWFSVDLGSGNDAEIVEVALTSRPDGFNEWPLYFAVEYSDDNSSWTTAWTPETWSTSWGNGVEKVFGRTAIAPAGYRYWRIRSSDTAVAGEYLGLAAVEMREGGVDRAGVATITASRINGSYPVRNTIDSNASTFWTSGAFSPPAGGHWVKFDFILPRNISETRLQVRPDAFREDPLDVYVEYSSDNTNWSTKWSQTGLSAWTASEQRTFTDPSPVSYDIPNVFFSKSIGHIVNRTADVVSGQFRQFGKVALATANTATNLVKNTAKAAGSTIDAIATMAKDFITGVTNYDRTFDASSNVEMVTIKSTTKTPAVSADVSATRLSLPGKVLAASSNMTSQAIRTTGKAFQRLADGIGSRVFSLARTTTVTTDGQGAVDTSKALLVAVNSTISTVTSTARSAGKLVTRTVDASASTAKTITSNITRTVAGIPAALKSVPKTLGSLSFTASTVNKSTTRDLTVDADTETATSKQTVTMLVAPVAAVSYIGRGVSRTFTSIVDATASAAKQVPLTISSTTSSVVNSVVTALTGAPVISNAIAYVEATFDIQLIPGRSRPKGKRAGGGANTFESATSVRRRNAELERERERKRLDEEQQRVTFTMSFNGKVVTKTYDIDESIVQTSINIRESIAKAVVAIKSIFIRKKDTTIAPVVRIKDDRD